VKFKQGKYVCEDFICILKNYSFFSNKIMPCIFGPCPLISHFKLNFVAGCGVYDYSDKCHIYEYVQFICSVLIILRDLKGNLELHKEMLYGLRFKHWFYR